LDVIAAQAEHIHRLMEENQALRDEVARLKNQKPKPTIRPSKLNEGESKGRGGSDHKGKCGLERRVDRTVVVEAKDVPAGSRFKGYSDYFVQELVIKARTTQYRVEKWLTPEGTLVTGELPAEAAEGHLGPTLRSFVLYQYYHSGSSGGRAQVTEPLILEQLREWGVDISSGGLHALITDGKERFHLEKDEILEVGLRVSGHIHAVYCRSTLSGRHGSAAPGEERSYHAHRQRVVRVV